MDDAAQDVFVAVHRQLPGFRGESQLRTWIYGITRHIAANHRRRDRRKAAPLTPLDGLDAPDQAPDPLERAQDVQAASFVERFLARLDTKKREVFLLAFVEEMTVPEVAAALSIPLNTAYTRLRRAQSRIPARAGAPQRCRTADDPAMKEVLDQARRGWSPGAADAARVRRAVNGALGRSRAACRATRRRIGLGSSDPAGRRVSPAPGRRRLLGRPTSGAAPGCVPTDRRAAWPSFPPRLRRPARRRRLDRPNRHRRLRCPPITARHAARRHPAEQPPGTPAESLAAEVRALRNIERALRDGNPGLATAFLDQLDRDVPNGQMRGRARRLARDRPLRARSTTVRRQLGPGLRRGISGQRLPRPRRTSVRRNGFDRRRRLSKQEAHAYDLHDPDRSTSAARPARSVRAAATSTSATPRVWAASCPTTPPSGTATPRRTPSSRRAPTTFTSAWTRRDTELFRSAPMRSLPPPTDPNVGYPPGAAVDLYKQRLPHRSVRRCSLPAYTRRESRPTESSLGSTSQRVLRRVVRDSNTLLRPQRIHGRGRWRSGLRCAGVCIQLHAGLGRRF